MDSLSALADPTRRRIVEALSARAMSSGEIAGMFAVTAPAISQHLKTLKAARLVQVKAVGQKRIYALDQAGIDKMSDWVTKIRRHWSPRLDALEARLNQEDWPA